MSWICPECNRTFRHPNQSHSCKTFPLEKHFLNRPAGLRTAWDKIYKTVTGFGKVQVSILENAIIVGGKSTFMAFKTRKEYAELEILLDEEFSEFPVYKTFRVSKSRVAHFIRIQSAEEVDKQLRLWLKRAYEKVGN
jgi:hypothetical protein